MVETTKPVVPVVATSVALLLRDNEEHEKGRYFSLVVDEEENGQRKWGLPFLARRVCESILGVHENILAPEAFLSSSHDSALLDRALLAGIKDINPQSVSDLSRVFEVSVAQVHLHTRPLTLWNGDRSWQIFVCEATTDLISAENRDAQFYSIDDFERYGDGVLTWISRSIWRHFCFLITKETTVDVPDTTVPKTSHHRPGRKQASRYTTRPW